MATDERMKIVSEAIGTTKTQTLIENATKWASSTSQTERDELSASSQAIFTSNGFGDLYWNNRVSWDWSTYSIPTKKKKKKKDPVVQFNKNEYSVGLFDIKASLMAYENTGIYISKPFDIKGNPIEVELQAYESHPAFDGAGQAATRQTSIEYYITYVNSPTVEQWLPILPRDERTVKNELLIFKSSTIATLRFVLLQEESINVYENGIRMLNHEWEIHPDCKHVQIKKGRFIPSNKYTIDYTPNASNYNPWTVNLIENGLSPIITKETFTFGTNRNGTLYLSRHPYVNKETDTTPIRVTLINANIASPSYVGDPYTLITDTEEEHEPFTKNITNYQGDSPALKRYSIKEEDLYLGFEYLHDGDQLQFTETFTNSNDIENKEINHGDADIEVEYKILAPVIRLKAILRNTSNEPLITPSLNKYVIYFNIMR
jgi:hypothetical protein